MDLLERAAILQYHRHRIAEFGGNAVQALGWRHADSQRLRFEVIAAAATRRTLVFNVLDAEHFPADHPLLVGRDVATIEAFCRGLPGTVEVVRGYAVDDATVVMRQW